MKHKDCGADGLIRLRKLASERPFLFGPGFEEGKFSAIRLASDEQKGHTLLQKIVRPQTENELISRGHWAASIDLTSGSSNWIRNLHELTISQTAGLFLYCL